MYRRILVVVNEGVPSRVAVAEGVALALVHDAEVCFLALLPRYTMPVTQFAMPAAASAGAFFSQAQRKAERRLAAASAAAAKAGVRCSSALESGADDAQCVVAAAGQRRCDLIVVASAGRSAVMRLLTGSLIPDLITLSSVPVLVVRRPTPAGRLRRERAGTQTEQSPRPKRPLRNGARA